MSSQLSIYMQESSSLTVTSWYFQQEHPRFNSPIPNYKYIKEKIYQLTLLVSSTLI